MIKKLLKKLRNVFVMTKMYLERSKTYIGYINFFMIIYLFVLELGINKKLVIPLFVIVILGSVFLGFLDVKLNVYSEEQRVNTLQNPVIKELLEIKGLIKREN